MANLRARWLRQNMTAQEVKLWVQLRYLKQEGFHFRRQVPIGSYIVDFAEKTAKLVIEVDGSQHADPWHEAQDRVRDGFVRSEGFRILRFWNLDIDQAMDGVIDAVRDALGGGTKSSLLAKRGGSERSEGVGSRRVGRPHPSASRPPSPLRGEGE
jgi:very-short-patch-repair endonuclease